MNSEKQPVDNVTLKGDWYYIVRDNYPAKNAEFYLAHAVRVNTKTGEVQEPK